MATSSSKAPAASKESFQSWQTPRTWRTPRAAAGRARGGSKAMIYTNADSGCPCEHPAKRLTGGSTSPDQVRKARRAREPLNARKELP
eukprot:4469614-Pyramimonas_sp.AAC.1